MRGDIRTRGRLDLHNVNTDTEAASSGCCAFTHLATGRVCHLPHRHTGPCRFTMRSKPPRRTAATRLR